MIGILNGRIEGVVMIALARKKNGFQSEENMSTNQYRIHFWKAVFGSFFIFS